MNPNIYKIKIDTILELRNEHFTVSANDVNSHKLNIEVTQNNEPYPLTDLTVEIDFLKSDGKLNRQNTDKGITITDPLLGKVDCILETNSINKQGRVRAEVLISKGGDLLTTKRFEFYATNPLASDKVIESTSQFPILYKLITRVDTMIQTQIDMVQAEGVREGNEQLRITLHSELLGLRSTLESLKLTLEDTNTDVEDNENNRIINENARIDNEVLRETLYNNLLQLEVDLVDLNNTTISLIADTSTAITNTNIATDNANSAATNANNVSDAITQAEGLRVTAESLRVTAEGLRVTAENARKTAEQARESNYTTKINEFIAETERVEAIYPTRLTKVENDFTAHKEDYAKLENLINEKTIVNDLTGETFPTSAPIGTTRILPNTFSNSQLLTKVIFDCVGTGTIKIKILKLNANESYNFVKDIPVQVVAGLNTIELNEPLEDGYSIGYYSNNVALKSKTGIEGTIGYYTFTGDILTNEVTKVASSSTIVAMAFEITTISDYMKPLKYLDARNVSVGNAMDGNSMSVGYTRILDYEFAKSALIQIKAYAKTVGTLKVKIFQRTDELKFLLIDEVLVSIEKTGFNILKINTLILDKSYIGLYSDDAQLTQGSVGSSIGYFVGYSNKIGDEITVSKNTLYNALVSIDVLESEIIWQQTEVNSKIQIESLKDTNIKPLYLETFDKTNQPLHPSVVYISGGFGGYKYWMVESPLPEGAIYLANRYECPSIHCSHDGVNWIVPNGLMNPIDDLTPSEITNGTFMSDPHLVYKNNTLEVWYRISGAGAGVFPDFPSIPTLLLRKTSTDGVTWSAREVMNNMQDPTSTLYNMVRSPSIIWDGTKYKMWFTDQLSGVKPTNVVYAESVDGFTWTNRQICTLLGTNLDKWHLDVHFSSGMYHMILHSADGAMLNYYTSVDGLTFSFKKEILKSNSKHNSNFNVSIYRSSLVWNGTNYLLYATGKNRVGLGTKWNISLAAGKTVDTLEFVDGSYFRNKQVFESGIRLINNDVMESPLELSENGDYIGYDYTLRKPTYKRNGITQYVGTFVTVPISSSSNGNVGEYSADANYLYVCHAKNMWIRVAKSAW